MYYLSSCSIVKNEDNYIDDFVAIHKKLGVEFFLFFDRSDNPLSERYKGRQDIQVIHYPEPNRHAQAWRDGVSYFQGKSRWVQFIDIDQVTVPMKTNDIKVMLQDYESNAALCLNWHSFGSNGREVEPPSTISTYEAYTKRAAGNTAINNHVQSIVQVQHAEIAVWHDPHHPRLLPNQFQFNERRQQFTGPWNIPPSQDVGFIAHYYTRSREYWAKKCAKMRADTGTVGGTLAEFDHHQSYMNAVEDFTVRDIWNSNK
jgi:Domain of unknown function.